jgi:hypothetical protein
MAGGELKLLLGRRPFQAKLTRRVRSAGILFRRAKENGAKPDADALKHLFSASGEAWQRGANEPWRF